MATYFENLQALFGAAIVAHWELGEATGATLNDSSGNGFNGTYTAGVVLGEPGIGDGKTSARFGANDESGNIFSAGLAAAWDRLEGTLFAWVRVNDLGTWYDAKTGAVVRLYGNGSNEITIQKSAVNLTVRYVYRSGGVTKSVSHSPVDLYAWFHVAITWSNSGDAVKAYLNGDQVGVTQTGLALFGSVLNEAVIGAEDIITPLSEFKGYIQHVTLLDRPATDPEILSAYQYGAFSQGDLIETGVVIPSTVLYRLQECPLVTNPAIEVDIVDDVVGAVFVADPFVIIDDDGLYHLFFETKAALTSVICHATSLDGLTWTYDQMIVDNTISTYTANAYPMVIKAGYYWYMVLDNSGGAATEVSLLRARTFPTEWVRQERLLNGLAYIPADSTILQWNNVWYLFVYDSTNVQTLLYSSPTLLDGTWTAHTLNPIWEGVRNSRPGGRPIVYEYYIDFFLQDGVIRYGNKLRCYRITTLTPTTFVATEISESPLLDASGSGWNQMGMHHLNRIDSNLSYVDGYDVAGNWSIGIYRDFTIPEGDSSLIIYDTEESAITLTDEEE